MRKFPSWFGRGNTRAALLSGGLLALLITTGLASAAGEGQPLDGGARNPSNNQSQAYERETEIIANTGTYGTRQSNKSTNGGAAIYGCRALTGNEACLRGSNLNNGLAFSFESRGPVAGQITAAGGENARPFTTNATGVATGLNADRVDGRDAQQIIDAAVAAARPAAAPPANTAEQRTRWLLVDARGEIVAQSGGFRVAAAYPTLTPTPADPQGLRANGNVYIDAGDDLSDNGINVTLALQNATDQNGDGITNGRAPGADNNPEFGGEVSTSQCGLTGFVTCAPPGTNNANHFVVSPRNSDGTVTTDNARKRFYVTITENGRG